MAMSPMRPKPPPATTFPASHPAMRPTSKIISKLSPDKDNLPSHLRTHTERLTFVSTIQTGSIGSNAERASRRWRRSNVAGGARLKGDCQRDRQRGRGSDGRNGRHFEVPWHSKVGRGGKFRPAAFVFATAD